MLATEGDDKNRLYHTTARVITLWFLDVQDLFEKSETKKRRLRLYDSSFS
jgi:hypothetical protein